MGAARRFDGGKRPRGKQKLSADAADAQGPIAASGLAYCGVPAEREPVACGPECRYCSAVPGNATQMPDTPRGECPTQSLYRDITVGENAWIQMACEEAALSVRDGGGPFGAVIVQIDDASGHVLRYWRNRNRVTQAFDPTAHAEITALRAACRDLGVFDLGAIRKEDARLQLPQEGTTSRCEIYCSCEPCPMCYAAIRWARIGTVVFAATRFAAAEPGVDFSDLQIYEELATPYVERERLGVTIRRSITAGAEEAFRLWRESGNVRY